MKLRQTTLDNAVSIELKYMRTKNKKQKKAHTQAFVYARCLTHTKT